LTDFYYNILIQHNWLNHIKYTLNYSKADSVFTGVLIKSLARPTSRCILIDGENISFDASLVIYDYINSINIPRIMIINRIYEHQKSSVAVACFLPGWSKDLSAPLYYLRKYQF